MGVFSMDILGRNMTDIQRRMVGQTNYRINVVKGVVATVNINRTFGCYIAGETVIYPKIPTFSRDPKLQVGDEVTIEFINGCRETPVILAPEDIRERPDTTEPISIKLYEYYLADGAVNHAYFYADSWWRGLTFTAESAHTINYVELLLAKSYSSSIPGTIYIDLYEVNESNVPTGEILTSGETDGNTLTYALDNPGENREWRRIDLTEYNLISGKIYAITLHLIGGTSTHSAGIWLVEGGSYDNGGALYSLNGGANWTYQWWNDSGFKIYGKAL